MIYTRDPDRPDRPDRPDQPDRPGRHGGHRHRHHHHGGPRGGGGGFGGGPFGGFGPGGGRGPRGRGRKARRGDIRTAALLLLSEEPRNGYQIMQEVEERSDGVWRPSPGSVYPALQQLEDEGLIRSEELEGRKLFRLTDDGRAYVKERGEGKPAPWEQMSGDVSDQAHELGKLMREVASAFVQVMKTGSEAQMGEARKVLAATRRDLYRILADGDPESSEGPADEGE
ncbi:MAG TPA: PadR family transcriptional regulator [Solirubrobacteraceae bacterium]|nr:PadR family transcriptional regulator [Solirubrobacteraceae bacterium]